MSWRILMLLLYLNVVWSDNVHGGKRSPLIGLISNKVTNSIHNFGHKSSRGVTNLGDFGSSAVNPISSQGAEVVNKLGNKTSTVIENVGNATSGVVEKTFEVAENVINSSFSDSEIHDLTRHFANSMGLRYTEDVDANKIKVLLDGLVGVDSSTKLLSADRTYCGLCKFLVRGVQVHAFTIIKVGEIICNIYILLATFTVSDFCRSIIKLNEPILTYVIDNSEILDPELACTILLQTRECTYEKPALQWITEVSSTPPIIPEVNVNSNEEPLTILHLTDFHITPDYEEGSISNCGYPICCKKGLGNSLKGKKAGQWGDYNCDIPPWLLGSTLLHLNSTYKNVSFVYFTGDIIDHTVWNTSIESNTKLIYHTYKALLETFPKAQIFSVIGNHESNPLNTFSPPDENIANKTFSTDWLYKLMAKIWQPWLPSESLKTVRYQGYYAYSVSPRFKVIGLNNNVCYNFNWWLLYNTTFINEQLQFLIRELVESEKIGQFVHILGHVSVGNQECISPWEKSYNAIIERFAHIIKGQFVGHTHTDELKIFYDTKGKPINVAYNGASLTPFVKFNPNYKVVSVQPTSLDILDIDTYYFNLTEANLYKDRSPAWKKLYSMKKAYNLPDMSPNSFGRFADNLLSDSNLQDQYWKYYIRLGDASLKEGCDTKCKKEIACKAVTTLSLYPEKPECD